MNNCPGCGAPLNNDDLFCGKCGRSAKPEQAGTSSLCSGCGAPLKGDMTFCASCGCPVGSNQRESTIRCDECGAILTGNESACGNCGCPIGAAQSEATHKCEECGAILKDNESACGNCGCPVHGFTTSTTTPVTTTSPSVSNVQSGSKTKWAITIGNIIFLLTMIPSSILLIGEVLIFKAENILIEPFGFFGFAKTFDYINNILNKLEALDGGSLDNARLITSILSYTNIVVIVLLIYKAGVFISGLSNLNKGEILKEACFTSFSYVGFCFLFCVLMELLLLSPINEAIEKYSLGIFGGEMSITIGSKFMLILYIAVFNLIVFGILKLIEKFSDHA